MIVGLNSFLDVSVELFENAYVNVNFTAREFLKFYDEFPKFYKFFEDENATDESYELGNFRIIMSREKPYNEWDFRNIIIAPVKNISIVSACLTLSKSDLDGLQRYKFVISQYIFQINSTAKHLEKRLEKVVKQSHRLFWQNKDVYEEPSDDVFFECATKANNFDGFESSVQDENEYRLLCAEYMIMHSSAFLDRMRHEFFP